MCVFINRKIDGSLNSDLQFKIGKEAAQMEAAARKMAEADKIAVAHMIAIVGKVLARMIAAVRMMVADHRLRDYCYSHHSSASPPKIVL